MIEFEVLTDALVARRDSTRFIDYIEGEHSERRLSMRELWSRAAGLLRHFQTTGAQPGQEMLLLVENNQQFVDAFWACMLGGIIAVPIPSGTNDEHRAKFFRILTQLANPFLCTDSKIFSRYEQFAIDKNLDLEMERLRSRTIRLDCINDIDRPGIVHAGTSDDIAFIQYSSGSTSAPKGITLTHRNLLTNIRAIARGINLTNQDVGLSWMPLTHDMGLIGFHLTLLVADVTHALMPTTLFVRRPQLWLVKASQKRASLLCSPNFGYKHFLKTFSTEKASQLDLSPVRLIFNGAEPISASLCEEFLSALSLSGLKESAMFPVYGLAEASLAVAFPEPEKRYQTVAVRRTNLKVGAQAEASSVGNGNNILFVCVGHAVENCELRISDETGAEMPARNVGHVLIRGENVTRNYYRNPEATRAALSPNGWLDTGDLGFICDTGLVITGRRKEILFVNGQNYYPQDIESVLDRRAGIELGKTAVCGIHQQSAAADEILVFVLHRGDLESFVAMVKTVKKCVSEHIGIAADQVIPIPKIPKTTSGKIQRYLLGQQYQNGDFDTVLRSLNAFENAAGPLAHHNEIEQALQEICNSLVGGKPVGLQDNIFELGTSSLTLAQIHQRIEAIYPGMLQVTDFFDYPTIVELAQYLKRQQMVQA